MVTVGPGQITDAVFVEDILQADGFSDSTSPTGLSWEGIPLEVSTILEADETVGQYNWD
jgi:hypothetical protein